MLMIKMKITRIASEVILILMIITIMIIITIIKKKLLSQYGGIVEYFTSSLNINMALYFHLRT